MQIVDGRDYLSEVKGLIIEYSQRLGRDLSFQNIDEELQNPAHKYTAPEGEIDIFGGKRCLLQKRRPLKAFD